jgi:hypothetical protein
MQPVIRRWSDSLRLSRPIIPEAVGWYVVPVQTVFHAGLVRSAERSTSALVAFTHQLLT